MLGMVLEELGKGVLWSVLREPELHITAIDFLLPQTEWSEETVYIGTEDMLKELGETLSVTVILSDCHWDMQRYQSLKGNIIATTYQIPELYHRIHCVWKRVRGWQETLEGTVFSEYPLEAAVDVLSQFIGGRVALEDGAGRLLYQNDFGLSQREGQPCREQSEALQAAVTISDLERGRLTFFPGEGAASWHKVLLGLAARYMDQLFQCEKSQLQQHNSSIEKFIADLVNGKLESQGIFEQRATVLHSPFGENEEGMRHYHLLLIKLPTALADHPSKREHFLSMLYRLMPGGNFAYCEKYMIGLFITKEIVHFHKEDFPELEETLKKYNAYGALVGLTTKYFRIKTLYQMCIQAVRVGKILYAKEDRRLFFPKDDYTEYMLIDLLRRAFCSIYKHDDIGYYINFPIMKLIRYDKKHKGSLHDILYYYLSCGCSVIKTAQALGIHKNTVTNKLAQIEEIVGQDLSDRQVQFDLLLSFKILNYFELCAKLPSDAFITDVPGDAIL